MSLAFLFHFLCAQHVSDINISIFRSLRLCCWITTSVLFSVRCVLEIWCGWFWVVLVLQAEAPTMQAASSVHYTTSCNHSVVLLRMDEIIARNMLSWLKLLIKLL